MTPQLTTPRLPSTNSPGLKLLLICALALVMVLPSFFVSSLVDERAQRLAPQPTATQLQHLPGTAIPLVSTYRSVNRSLKYVLLFLGLVFGTYFGLEVTTGKQVHPAQYVLVGIAQLIFYLLLLSFAEKIGFDFAFLLAGSATIALLATNASWVFAARTYGRKALAAFLPLYTFIYLLLRLENDALLIGAIASFVTITAIMYLTRRIDWYNAAAQPLPVPPGSVPSSPPLAM